MPLLGSSGVLTLLLVTYQTDEATVVQGNLDIGVDDEAIVRLFFEVLARIVECLPIRT